MFLQAEVQISLGPMTSNLKETALNVCSDSRYILDSTTSLFDELLWLELEDTVETKTNLTHIVRWVGRKNNSDSVDTRVSTDNYGKYSDKLKLERICTQWVNARQ